MRSDEIAQHSFESLPKVKSDIETATEVRATFRQECKSGLTRVQRLNTLNNTLQGDMVTLSEIRNSVTRELKNAELAVRYIERLSANLPLLPQQNLALPPQYSPFPSLGHMYADGSDFGRLSDTSAS